MIRVIRKKIMVMATALAATMTSGGIVFIRNTLYIFKEISHWLEQDIINNAACTNEMTLEMRIIKCKKFHPNFLFIATGIFSCYPDYIVPALKRNIGNGPIR